MAEFDRSRIAAVFAADTELEIRSGLSALFGSQLDKDTYTMLIQFLERILFIDLGIIVRA